jgi:quinone-modifying oxidoreductase subunit QmoA
LAYCSGICCLASLKQATYLRAQNPESEAHVFYIDLRASGTYEDFLNKVQEDENVSVRKGKVAAVEEDPATGNLRIEVEDILGGGKLHMEADLVVLATGMVPSVADDPLPFQMQYDEYGFCAPNGRSNGIIAAGVARTPTDVAATIRDATGAALKAIQSIRQK